MSGRDEAVAAAILDHLARHPEACDTIEGIARWWLGAQTRATLDEIASALQALERKGAVAAVESPAGEMWRASPR
jgi:hypothetical protein